MELSASHNAPPRFLNIDEDHYSPRQDSALGETLFEHALLNNARSDIRLLEIHRSKLDGHYSVTLSSWPIAAAPEYAALSYTWGDDWTTETICVNRQIFKVTPNCRYAIKQLHYLSPCQRYRYYWIDAICIDQSRNDERSHQVNMMDDIFSRADRVFVSLGKHFDGSEYLFDNIPMTPFDSRKAVAAWLDRLSSETSWNIYRGLVATGRAAYWTRVWILQEFILARRLTILCGDSCADWQTLNDVMSTIVAHRGRMCAHANKAFRAMRDQIASSSMRLSADARHPLHYPTYGDQGQSRQIDRNVRLRALSTILTTVQGRACTDPRDRIFGILGLVDWHDYDPPVQADYSMNRLETAVKCVMHLSYDTCSLHELDIRVLLRTLELGFNDTAIQWLIHTRRVVQPPQDRQSPEVAHRRFMGGFREFASVDRKRRLIPHGRGAPLEQRNMILKPECDLLEGDVAVEECSSGDQFILRWLKDNQWDIIGIARLTTGSRSKTKREQTKSFCIFMAAEDLLVWYCLKSDFAKEVALGGRVRVVAHASASYALAGPSTGPGSDLDSDQDISLSDPDIF